MLSAGAIVATILGLLGLVLLVVLLRMLEADTESASIELSGPPRWEVTTTWPKGDGPGPSPGQEDRVMLVQLRTPEGVDQVELLNDLLGLGWDALVGRDCDSGWREQHPRLYRGKKIPTDAVSWSIESEDG